jgi:hypothetical protein
MLLIPFSGPTKFTKNALLLFIGSDTPNWTEIKEVFKEWSTTNVVEPELIVLADDKSARQLREAKETESESTEALEVIGTLCNVWLFSYTGSGYVYHVAKEPVRQEVDGMADILEPAIKSFISAELRSGSVVAAAPPGFYFSKLSNRHSSHFIRTESLLSCTASIELFALRLLEPFRTYCDGLADTKIRILVDSMVIWPLAQALISMRRAHNSKSRYIIESFRSYDGLADNSVESGPAFVIISASTSGGLEQRIHHQLGHRHVECFTILGLELRTPSSDGQNAEQARKFLYVVPRELTGPASLEGLRPLFEPDVPEVPPGCESVRIIGERFLNQNFRPKPVRLAHKALEDGRKITLANIAKEGAALSARRRPGGKSYWSLSFDIAALVDKYCIDNSDGECLLRSWLTNYAVAGDMAVVYPVDTLESERPGEGEGRRMAERIRELLAEKTPSAEIRILDSLQLDRPDESLRGFLLHAGVVVAAPMLGNGFVFKQISAALRAAQPKGPRLYLALVTLAESHARLQELRNDLKLNADESAYHFKCAIQMPVGKLDQDIDWYEESQILGRLVETCEEKDVKVPPLLKDRLRLFREGNGLSGQHAFMPSFGGAALSMSPGFLLWKTKAAIAGDNLGAAVLLTVAVFLEACRAGGIRDSETSLVSGLFQQTLIAPANFTRFNDPAIQAALLRAAYKSELNFSSSPDMSGDMQRLILRLMDLHDAPAGEALPEFILALATGRVTLMKEHMEEVLNKAQELPGWLRILADEIVGFKMPSNENVVVDA